MGFYLGGFIRDISLQFIRLVLLESFLYTVLTVQGSRCLCHGWQACIFLKSAQLLCMGGFTRRLEGVLRVFPNLASTLLVLDTIQFGSTISNYCESTIVVITVIFLSFARLDHLTAARTKEHY
jgi:hypothetical protein